MDFWTGRESWNWVWWSTQNLRPQNNQPQIACWLKVWPLIVKYTQTRSLGGLGKQRPSDSRKFLREVFALNVSQASRVQSSLPTNLSRITRFHQKCVRPCVVQKHRQRQNIYWTCACQKAFEWFHKLWENFCFEVNILGNINCSFGTCRCQYGLLSFEAL